MQKENSGSGITFNKDTKEQYKETNQDVAFFVIKLSLKKNLIFPKYLCNT